MKEKNIHGCIHKTGDVIGNFTVEELSNQTPSKRTLRKAKSKTPQVYGCLIEEAALLPKNQGKPGLEIKIAYCFKCQQGAFARLKSE